jgi:haloalkane dehalogenase
MSYLDEGPRGAPVVLMVHGNPSWSFLYRSHVVSFRHPFRCIVPDHLGCGLSDKPQGYDYCLKNHIENLGRLIDSLGIKRARLIVHDWGGPIGFGAARRRKDFVEKFVVMNTAAFPSRRIPLRIAACRLPWIGEFLVRGANAFSKAAVHMAVEEKLPPAVREAYLWPHQSWEDRVAVHRFVRDIPLGPVHKSFAEVEAIAGSLKDYDAIPGFILWGGLDWCFDEHFFEEWKRRLPSAREMFLPRAAHWLLEDDPKTVAREIGAFL